MLYPTSVSTLIASWSPSHDEAQDSIERELSDPRYSTEETNPLYIIGNKIQEWLARLLYELTDVSGGAPILPWVIVGVVLILVIIALALWLRPSRFGVRRKSNADTELVDPTISADQYLQYAGEAYDHGRYSDSLVAAFRALVQDGFERAAIDVHPSLTASLAGVELSQAFGNYRDGISQLVENFNSTLYGDEVTDATQAVHAISLVRHIRAATPTYSAHTGSTAAGKVVG